MDLPPIVIPLRPEGLDTVKNALKGVRAAMDELEAHSTAEAIKAKRVREGLAKMEADAVIREAKRAQAEKEKIAREEAAPRNFFGDIRRTAAASRGLREYSGSMAFEQALGKTAAQLIGLHGAVGIGVGAIHLFQSGLSLAASALTQFGGFILSDIIKPQLDLGTKSQQLANRMGGSATGAGVRDAINDLFGKNAQADLSEVSKTFEVAATKTKDIDSAKLVAGLALQANKAYGFDSAKMAEFIGGKRAALPNLNDQQFSAFISAQIAASSKGSVTPEQFVATQGKVENLLTRFAGSGTDAEKAARETGVANLLNAATGKGGTSTAAVTGLDRLVQDISQSANHPALKGSVGPGGAVDLVKALTAIVSTTGGDLTKLGSGPKGVPLMNYQVGTLNKSSLDFIRSLGLDETYKQAGGGAAGEAAVTEQLKRILDPAEGASKLLEDSKKTEAQTGYRLDAAWRTVEKALIDGIVPVLEQQGPQLATTLTKLASDVARIDWKATFDVMASAVKVTAAAILSVAALLPGEAGDAAQAALDKLNDQTNNLYKQDHYYTPQEYAQKATQESGRKEVLDLATKNLSADQIKSAMGKDGRLDVEKLTVELFKDAATKGDVGEHASVMGAAAKAGVDPVKVGEIMGGKAGDAFAAKLKDIEIKLDPARFVSQDKRPTA